MKMRINPRITLQYVVLVAALVLNPLWACRGPEYSYSVKDVRGALAGTWTVTVKGQTSTFRINLGSTTHQSASRSSLVAPASACSHRTLVSSAEACMDVTEVRLELVAIDGQLPTEGWFDIFGLSFDEARMRLRVGDTDIEARVTKTGDVVNVGGSGPGPSYGAVEARLVHARESL